MKETPDATAMQSLAPRPGRLKDKVVLVVGAGCFSPSEIGIGKACALAFADEGASVFAVDNNGDALDQTVRAIRERSGEVRSHLADVVRPAEIAAMVAACRHAYGRIDVIFYNVAVGEVGGPPELSEESWDRTWNINCKGLFLTCKHALPGMIERGRGNIIGVSSIAGIRYPGYGHFAYGTSKAAMIQFVRYLGIHYAAAGIRANTILPGLIDTPRVMRLTSAYGEEERSEVMRRRAAQVPSGLSGSPWDIAAAALFLASDESRYVTATELLVDGGVTGAYGNVQADRMPTPRDR